MCTHIIVEYLYAKLNNTLLFIKERVYISWRNTCSVYNYFYSTQFIKQQKEKDL